MDSSKNHANFKLKSENINNKRTFDTNFLPILVKIPSSSNQYTIPSNQIHIYKDQFKIGRKSDNDAVILDVLISRNHCKFIYDENSKNWIVENLSSTDTLLNNIPITKNEKKIIKKDDILQLSLSDNYKYQFTLVEQESDENVKSKQMNSVDELTDSNEENEQRDLKKQLDVTHIEQQKLRCKLEKLLEEEKATKSCNQILSNRIAELMEKIEYVNTMEVNFQEKYKNLLKQFEEKKKEYDKKLAKEKQDWEEALEKSKKENKLLEITVVEKMQEWKSEIIKKKQEEWQQKKDSVMQEEKMVQMTLLNENSMLEKKCKEIEQALKQKEQAQQHQIDQTVISTNCIVTEDERKTKGEKHNLPILDIIDLTEDNDEPSVNVIDKIYNHDAVIDKVNSIFDEQLRCSICSELFVMAMILDCMHTFCRYCIDKWFKIKRECPTCRAKSSVMTRSLVLDNFIEKMIDSLTPEQSLKRKLLIEERQKTAVRSYTKKAKKKR